MTETSASLPLATESLPAVTNISLATVHVTTETSTSLPLATQSLHIATKISLATDDVSTAGNYLTTLGLKKVSMKVIPDIMTKKSSYLAMWTKRMKTDDPFVFIMLSILGVYKMGQSRGDFWLLDGLGMRRLFLQVKDVKLFISVKLDTRDEDCFTLKEETKKGMIQSMMDEGNSRPNLSTLSYKEGRAPNQINRKLFLMDLA